MYWKSAVRCERLFSSAGYIVNKTRSSLEANTVNMLMCFLSSVDIWTRKCFYYLLFI